MTLTTQFYTMLSMIGMGGIIRGVLGHVPSISQQEPAEALVRLHQ